MGKLSEEEMIAIRRRAAATQELEKAKADADREARELRARGESTEGVGQRYEERKEAIVTGATGTGAFAARADVERRHKESVKQHKEKERARKSLTNPLGGATVIGGLAGAGSAIKSFAGSDIGKGVLAATGVAGAVGLAALGIKGLRGRSKRRSRTASIKKRIKNEYLRKAHALSFSDNPSDLSKATKFLARARAVR